MGVGGGIGVGNQNDIDVDVVTSVAAEQPAFGLTFGELLDKRRRELRRRKARRNIFL